MVRVIGWVLVVACLLPTVARAAEGDYRIGRAASDITLPVWGIQMLGYVHPKQISEGLRQRLYARTFVIADETDSARLAFVTCDVAFVTHTVKLAVLEKLQAELGERYTQANLVLAGTHTHGAPGGYHHHLSISVLGGDFFPQAFEALVEGIAESVLAADADLAPGKIFLAQGNVKNGNANRSLVAYRNNPVEERERYDDAVDARMTLLKFVRDDGAVGLLNWFAVHPTSLSFNFKLVASDNKGYAAEAVERALGAPENSTGPFVAAFANSNAGDATPNLNLDATGPGQNELESCAIMGQRQADTALALFASAQEPVTGPIDVRHTFVDFSQLVVADEFTGDGPQHTCPSAWGYSFAAGSDAEGGGHPLFREGMTEKDPGIDTLIRLALPNVRPTPEFLECHRPKAVLIASGLAKPPLHEQVVPVAVARLGQLAFVIGPCEFTTMSGRRFRAAVGRELGIDPRLVVVAGYANDFAGYVTTWHEYQLQQYEGGHTLFGPWSEAGYRQEFVRLARALRSGEPVASSVRPIDMRTLAPRPTKLDGPDEVFPAEANYGDVVTSPQARYAAGAPVSVTFWTGSPVNEYDRRDQFMAVERFSPEQNVWVTAATDRDWTTSATWQRISADGDDQKPKKPPRGGLFELAPPRYSTSPAPFHVTVVWETSDTTPAGKYRLVHFGRAKQNGQVQRFTAVSPEFEVGP